MNRLDNIHNTQNTFLSDARPAKRQKTSCQQPMSVANLVSRERYSPTLHSFLTSCGDNWQLLTEKLPEIEQFLATRENSKFLELSAPIANIDYIVHFINQEHNSDSLRILIRILQTRVNIKHLQGEDSFIELFFLYQLHTKLEDIAEKDSYLKDLTTSIESFLTRISTPTFELCASIYASISCIIKLTDTFCAFKQYEPALELCIHAMTVFVAIARKKHQDKQMLELIPDESLINIAQKIFDIRNKLKAQVIDISRLDAHIEEKLSDDMPVTTELLNEHFILSDYYITCQQNYANAISKLIEILNHVTPEFEKSQDGKNKIAMICKQISKLAFEHGDYTQAEEYAEIAKRQFINDKGEYLKGYLIQIADLNVMLAKIYIKYGDNPAAQDFLLIAFDIYAKYPSKLADNASLSILLAQIFSQSGHINNALAYGLYAVDSYRELMDSQGYFVAACNLGRLLLQNNNPRGAINVLNQFIVDCKDNLSNSMLADVNLSLAECYMQIKDFAHAEKSFLEVMQRFDKQERPEHYSYISARLIKCYAKLALRNRADSLEKLYAAIDLYNFLPLKRSDDRDKMKEYADLCELLIYTCITLKEHEAVGALCESFKQLCTKRVKLGAISDDESKLVMKKVVTLNTIVTNIYLEPESGVETLPELNEESSKENREFIADASYKIAMAFFDMEDNENAKLYFEKALKAYKLLPNCAEHVAGCQYLLGSICSNIKDYTQAIKYFEQAAIFYLHLPDMHNYALTLAGMVDGYVASIHDKQLLVVQLDFILFRFEQALEKAKEKNSGDDIIKELDGAIGWVNDIMKEKLGYTEQLPDTQPIS